MDFQQVSLVATLVQADTPLGKLDEIVLGFLQLEHIHVGTLVDGACVEEKLMGRDIITQMQRLKEALIKAHYNRVCRGNQRQQAKDEAILGGK